MSFGGSTEGKKEKSVTKEASSQDRSGIRTEQLQLEQSAIDKIVQDVLGGANGLKDIFGGEQTVGLFDSSVAAQASGDLAAKLVGEIAKLTGKNVINENEQTTANKRTDFRGHSLGMKAEGKFQLGK